MDHYHLSAYTLGTLAVASNIDVPALADSVLTISNGHFRLTDAANLVMAAAISPTVTRCRLDSPTLRLPGQPFIIPCQAGQEPADWPKIADWRKYPLPLPAREEIAAQMTITAAGPERGYVLIWSQFTYKPMPTGKIQWVRGTSTTAAVASAWTNLSLTLDSSLPTGFWCMIGSIHQSTTAVAHRIIFPGQVARPGHLSKLLTTNRDYYSNFDGGLGEMGRFVNDNPFQVEGLCFAADASHEFFFGLVQVAGLQ